MFLLKIPFNKNMQIRPYYILFLLSIWIGNQILFLITYQNSNHPVVDPDRHHNT